MRLYWFAPILCGALGFGVSLLLKQHIVRWLRGEWLRQLLTSEKVTKAIENAVGQKLVELTQDTRTIEELIDGFIGKEEREAAIAYSSTTLAGVITVELKKSKLAFIILDEIKRVLEEKVKTSFLSNLVSGSVWDLVEEPLEKAIENYLDKRCQPLLEVKLKESITGFTKKRMYEVGDALLGKRQEITKVVVKAYEENAVELIDAIVMEKVVNQPSFIRHANQMVAAITGFGVFCGLLSAILTLF